MTILNFCFNDDRATFVSDELVTRDPPRPEDLLLSTSKVIALPHLRSLVALTGETLLSCELDEHFRTRCEPNADLGELAQELTAVLQLACQRRGFRNSTARAIVVGFGRSDRIQGFALWGGNDFRVERLTPGAYCQPPVLDNGPCEAATDWCAIEERIITACVAQRTQRSVASGGRFHHTRLSRDGISISWTASLPNVEAFPA